MYMCMCIYIYIYIYMYVLTIIDDKYVVYKRRNMLYTHTWRRKMLSIILIFLYSSYRLRGLVVMNQAITQARDHHLR